MSDGNRAREIFEACLALPSEERIDYLEERCSGAPDLKSRVQRLLKAHSRMSGGSPGLNNLPKVKSNQDVTTFGSYTNLQKLGEGGMGVVYKATDRRLHREVALKVLQPALAQKPEVIVRFEREAQVLASISHQGIAAIHGLEEDNGSTAIVLEFVEGPTLADRISEGPIPLEEALVISRKIAEALEAAHKKGVVHRDLKPANVKLTPEGTVKVLDFGLAKSLEKDTPLISSSTMNSLTQPGSVLGTPSYMSPEQARSREVDARSDIWALGCLLFEMLSGVRAFKGESLAEVLAKVVSGEPEWIRLPQRTPGVLFHLLKRCLEKDPDERLQSVGEFRIIVSKCLADPEGADHAYIRSGGSEHWFMRVSGLVSILSLVLVLVWAFWPEGHSPPTALPLHLELLVNGQPGLFANQASAVVLAPDGSTIAFVTGVSGVAGSRSLHLRRLQDPEVVTLEGTEGAYSPFFSFDGQWIGFATVNEIRKISVSGGEPISVYPVNRSRGACWGPGGRIVIAPERSSGLVLVREHGEDAVTVSTLAVGEWSHRWPQFLPGGRHVLFTAWSSPVVGRARLEVLDLDSGERKVVQQGATYGRYSPSGHILFWRAGSVFAAPFDLDSLEITSEAKPVLHGIPGNIEGGANFDVASNGTLVHLEGSAFVESEQRLVWIEKDGRITPASNSVGMFSFGMKLSPDDRQLAVGRNAEGNVDIWIHDLERGVPNRITFSEAADGNPVWVPDGKSIFFSSNRAGHAEIYRTLVDGTGQVRLVSEGEFNRFPDAVSPDGRFLVFHEDHPETDMDLWMLPLSSEGEPEPFLQTRYRELGARFSPDGKWLAYVSNESGEGEVYVRPFPPGSGKWRVSSGGGAGPRWSHDGKRLFFRQDRQVWESTIRTRGDELIVGKPSLLVEVPDGFPGGLYDITSDGDRVLRVQSLTESERANRFTLNRILVGLNWFEELRETFTESN